MLAMPKTIKSVHSLMVGMGIFFVGLPGAAYAATIPDKGVEPVCRGVDGYAADFDGRRTFLWRPQWLDAIKASSEHSAGFVSDAEQALRRGPYTVTDKPAPVHGASLNDYASIGPYWWPDPSKANGLPYVRRDGEVNPARNGLQFDKNRLRALGDDLEALSVAYFITSDHRFADHAAGLVRVWFLDPATRMNPHMNFAQGIPGKVKGRGEGIIEASDLSTVIESIGLIAPANALTSGELDMLRAWYAEFASWLATSELGGDEMRKHNNHGVFFDFYLAHFAIFAGLEGTTKSLAENFLESRIGVQMDQQGRFSEELKRTRSWHYSNYLVSGAARLATIGECVDVDLWNSQLEDGRSLSTARQFLLRYSTRLEEWPFPDRDKDAGSFSKMQNIFDRTDFMFRAPGHQPDSITLP